VADVLDRTDVGAVLEGFGRRARRQDPVFHFYETFLAAYDPNMRETRGVYYTPEPVVSYIVRSLHRLLGEEFSMPEGLAHSGRLPCQGDAESAEHRLLILDPAVGTGTFLHEVVATIEQQVKGSMGEGVWGGANGYVAQHLLPRIFGFELLMAPYTVAHMKIGLQLQESGYAFDADRRLGIFLTNTLEPGVAAGSQYYLTDWLRDEAAEALSIKRDRPVMVVLGNPPYSGHSANTGMWIADLLRGLDRTDDQRCSYPFLLSYRGTTYP
jgi:predicted helicase